MVLYFYVPYLYIPSSSFLPHLRVCSRFWSLGLSFLFLDQGQSVGLLGRVISSSQGLYLYTNTKKKKTHTHTQTINLHALSGIRTDGPGFRASEDSASPRPLGYCDRLISPYCMLLFLWGGTYAPVRSLLQVP
jgi:hypothetical protein